MCSHALFDRNAVDFYSKLQQQNSAAPYCYVSDRKAGTVKIQVRSRSEQTSPTNGIISASRTPFRGGGNYDDKVRSQQTIHPQTSMSNRNFSSSSFVDGAQVQI